jgi:hypothetical protein
MDLGVNRYRSAMIWKKANDFLDVKDYPEMNL